MKFLLPIFGLFATIFSYGADIAILPTNLELLGPESTHRIVTVKKQGELYAGRAAKVNYTSSNPQVAIIENGVVKPKGNGTATITAKSGSAQAQIPVTVKNYSKPFDWSFTNHILPILSRNDCNTGGCHGAIAGKGGFRLSLDGYDPPSDYYTIAKEMRGRRIELAAPARSLLLTKPTMAVAHKGGKQLDTRSFDYRVLSEWIVNGANPAQPSQATLSHLEVLPEQSLLSPGSKQQLIVRAHYSDGRVNDVTHWAKFTSTDATVASVDKNGLVEIIGSGQGAVTAWFSSQVVLARLTVPFANDLTNDQYTNAPKANFIDEMVLEQLQRLQLLPSPRTKDETFLRRVYLDTIGIIPTVEEVTSFVADDDPQKRNKLIDELLSRDEFVDYWTYRFSDVFLINGKLLRPESVKAYYHWIRNNIEKNTPWDEVARQLVVAKGSSYENGATNFYAVHQDPETMAENVSQAFLSLSINCAKCHNHPLEKWTNDQYYAFANLFSRVRAKGWGGDARNGNGLRTLYVEPSGDLIQPRTGKPQPPAPLDGEPLDPTDTTDRREYLAQWLTAPENPYFSRAITNRIWANFFGIGLVDPVDDLRVSNPASNEPLFDALANYLVDNKYNLRALMKLILNSETYQRSSDPLSENKTDSRYFSRYYPRRLMAEVLHDTIHQITHSTPDFNQIVLSDGSKAKTEAYQKGTRALELYDSAVESYFLKVFGRNTRDITCECERSNQPSMVQVLHLSNGDTLNKNLAEKQGVVTAILEFDGGHSQMLDIAYLMCLSRQPTETEKEKFLTIFAQTPPDQMRTAVEDLFWALMTSREFLFQH